MKNNGFKIGHQSARKYVINHSFFGEWSRDMAYVLGLWWADGGIIGNRITFSLHRRDKYLLEKISSAMGSNYHILRSKNNFCFSFNSYRISQDIRKIGGYERKSLTIGCPNVPSIFISDFLRGVFDGDGSIWVDKNRYPRANILTCSKTFFEGMCGMIDKVCLSYRTSIRKISGYNSTRYDILFNGESVKRFGAFLYGNNPCLFMRRKRDGFNRLGQIIEKPTLEHSKYIARRSGCMSANEWVKYKKKNKIKNVYARPDRIKSCCSEWKGWDDFLGIKTTKEHSVDGKIIWNKIVNHG